MKEFTEDEKMIAKNIDKKYKWIARDGNKRMYVFDGEPTKSVIANAWQTEDIASGFPYAGMFEAIKWEDDEPTRIRDIYGPQILDDVEREYLRTVLKPFHDDVTYVVKHRDANAHFDENTHDQEFLFISLEDGFFIFPDFDEGKMYFGMELDKKYKLNELGIIYEDEKK